MLSHRVVGAGKRSQGSVRARAIKGMPRYTGLINWSKKLSIMVSFKAPLWAFLCFGVRAHSGKYGL